MTTEPEVIVTEGLVHTVATVSLILALHGGGRLRFGCDGDGDETASAGTPQAIWAEASWPDGRTVRGSGPPTADHELGALLALKAMLERLGPEFPPVDLTILDAR